MKATVPVAVPPQTKLVHLQYDDATGDWILWVQHDLQFQNGTQLRLQSGGGIERVILRPDGTEERFKVR